MDPFTEKILQRARERQRKLLEYNSGAINSSKSSSDPVINDSNGDALIKRSKDVKSYGSTPIITESDFASTCSNATAIAAENSVCKTNRILATSETNLIGNTNISDHAVLKGSASEGNFPKLLFRQNSKMNVTSEIPGSPQLKTLNIQKENFNMEIKLCSSENVRIEVELQEESDSNDEDKENKDEYNSKSEDAEHDDINQASMRDGVKKKLQRLGKLYAGGEDADISSPIHRTEPTFSAEDRTPKTKTTERKIEEKDIEKQIPKTNKGLGGLATLAKIINQWEDNLSNSRPIASNINNQSNVTQQKQINKNTLSSTRPVISATKSAAIANKAIFFESTVSPTKNVTPNKDPALLSVSERKALFEKNTGAAPIPKAPISMPTPIFKEKTKSTTDINSISPTKEIILTSKDISRSAETVTSKESIHEPELEKIEDTTDSKPGFRSPAKSASKMIPGTKVGSPTKTGGIATKVAALFQSKTTISQQQIENEIREQRQKEMDILLNRFHKNKGMVQDKIKNIICQQPEVDSEDEEVNETTAMIPQKNLPKIVKKPQGIPPPPPLPGNKRKSGGKRYSSEDSTEVAAVLDDVKRIKVTISKPGLLYPNLSDIEATTETETENNISSTPSNSSFENDSCGSDINAADTSFGREMMETVYKHTPQKRIYDESTASDISDILDDMDNYLDEAVAYASPNKSGPTPSKRSRSLSPEVKESQSASTYQCKNCSPQREVRQQHDLETNAFRTPSKIVFKRRSSEFPTYVVDGDEVLPLKHTVSFYRKQQTQGPNVTPTRHLIRQTATEEPSEDTDSPTSDKTNETHSKIQGLHEELIRQEAIISQASRALNLCYATPEFTGSTEQVEAEKLLLLATHRHMAAKCEIDRLSTLKVQHGERGSLTISNMILPLKRDYVRALNAAGGKGHHVMCLIKHAEQVYGTRLVSTVATNDRNPNLELVIPGKIYLDDVYSNLAVQFEVYCLQAQEEILPHEVKYHITNKKTNSKVTPKKAKHDSRLVRPPKESPGGPQAVRSSTFALMGCVTFSIHSINRKNWTLKSTPSMSPLEGIVEMKIKCELSVPVEHRGFLTLFKDVSGLGAWHRRWCLLKGHILSYWKYPEEEKTRTPIDSIDLTNCITQQIDLVHRDICARLHTILIETNRPALPQDKDSLIMQCKGNNTVIRHLLSADTKEERIEWCTMFNKALNIVKIDKSMA